MDRPFFSIIIPTYNSEKTLEYTLASINNQVFGKNELEVLIVDGGSTDLTVDIANKFGARVIVNEYKLPEYAKMIGVKSAKGRYIVRMDSDEEFTYSTQLADKKRFYESHPDIPVLISNLYTTGRRELCGVSASYMNVLGDPFSYFVYQTDGDKCTTYKRYVKEISGNEQIMQFEKSDMMPLADSGTCSYSLDYIKQRYPDEYDTIEFTCGTFNRIIYDNGICGCIKGDNIRHNCNSGFVTYLRKLRFRVINNVFHKEESGFSSHINIAAKKRTILFCIYSAIVPVPIIDSIRLAIKYKDITFLLHFIYLYYICICILFAYIGRLFGKVRDNASYG